ncbi:MAG TPA: endonuclease III [Dongiaceae bacterium]
MKPADVVEFFNRLAAANPDPRGELQYINPYTLLVAVVLSAQATDASVNRATEPLFKFVDTPAKMLKLGETKLKEHVRTIGLYNTKAKNIIRLSQILIDQYGGEVPADRDILQTLPGVGRKTANVVLNIVFRHPTMAVDTHIFRVCNRTGLAAGTTPDKVEQKLEKVVPENRKLNAHHWLILHGRYICKARKPDCPVCIVRDLCRYKAKTIVSVDDGADTVTPTPTRPRQVRAPVRRTRGRGK